MHSGVKSTDVQKRCISGVWPLLLIQVVEPHPRPAESESLETATHANEISVKLEEKNKTILHDKSEKKKKKRI